MITRTPKTPAEEVLQKVYNKDVPAVYIAATLEAEGFVFNPDSYEPAEGVFDRDENETQPYNDYEMYLWSKIYLEHKTPSHAYYTKSQEIVNKFERK